MEFRHQLGSPSLRVANAKTMAEGGRAVIFPRVRPSHGATANERSVRVRSIRQVHPVRKFFAWLGSTSRRAPTPPPPKEQPLNGKPMSYHQLMMARQRLAEALQDLHGLLDTFKASYPDLHNPEVAHADDFRRWLMFDFVMLFTEHLEQGDWADVLRLLNKARSQTSWIMERFEGLSQKERKHEAV